MDGLERLLHVKNIRSTFIIGSELNFDLFSLRMETLGLSGIGLMRRADKVSLGLLDLLTASFYNFIKLYSKNLLSFLY